MEQSDIDNVFDILNFYSFRKELISSKDYIWDYISKFYAFDISEDIEDMFDIDFYADDILDADTVGDLITIIRLRLSA